MSIEKPSEATPKDEFGEKSVINPSVKCCLIRYCFQQPQRWKGILKARRGPTGACQRRRTKTGLQHTPKGQDEARVLSTNGLRLRCTFAVFAEPLPWLSFNGCTRFPEFGLSKSADCGSSQTSGRLQHLQMQRLCEMRRVALRGASTWMKRARPPKRALETRGADSYDVRCGGWRHLSPRLERRDSTLHTNLVPWHWQSVRSVVVSTHHRAFPKPRLIKRRIWLWGMMLVTARNDRTLSLAVAQIHVRTKLESTSKWRTADVE